MTKKQMRRLRRMKEIAKENEEVKPDYSEKEDFWNFTKKPNFKKQRESLKEDGLSGDDLAEWKRLLMADMRAMWAAKKVQGG